MRYSTQGRVSRAVVFSGSSGDILAFGSRARIVVDLEVR